MMHYSNECLCSHFRYVEFIPFVACVTFHQILMGVPGPSPYFQELARSASYVAGYILNSNATISAPWNYLEIVYHLWFIRYGKKNGNQQSGRKKHQNPFLPLLQKCVCITYCYILVEFHNICLYKNLNFKRSQYFRRNTTPKNSNCSHKKRETRTIIFLELILSIVIRQNDMIRWSCLLTPP